MMAVPRFAIAAWALILLASCAGPRTAVESTQVDPRTGLLRRLVILVQPEDVSGGTYFLVQAAPSGQSTYWDVERTRLRGAYAEVTLTLRAEEYRPHVGQSIWVYEINPASGAERFVGLSSLTYSQPNTILDGDFSTWETGDADTTPPVGWSTDASGSFRIMELLGSGVRLEARGGAHGSHVTLIQRVLFAGGVFRARVRPDQGCSIEGGELRDFFGLAISDSRGERVIACITGGPHEVVQEEAPFQVVDMIPGRIGAWNEVTLDPSSAALAPFARFVFGPDSPLTLTVEDESSGLRPIGGDVDHIGVVASRRPKHPR